MPVECVCQNPTCGKIFVTIPSRIAAGKDKCCSKACADQCKRIGQIECICHNSACQKTFYLSASVLRKSNRPYCSLRCRSEANTELHLCQNPACGKAFRISQAEIRKGGGKYCSWECRPTAQPCVCQSSVCRKTFLEIPSNIAQGRGKYCSHDCHQAHHKNSWEERFWSNVARCDHELWCPYCCWEWQAGTSLWGYGLFKVTIEGKTKSVRAHRIAWTLLNAQPIPPGLWGLHHCDNPPCCNPMHIYAGTARDNSRDAVVRGRVQVPHYGQIVRGERQWQSKLTETQVREIVQRHRAGEFHSVIAKNLGVSRSTITQVLHGKNWRHVTETLEVVAHDSMQPHNHVGERNTRAKLTNEQVRQIRALFLQGHLMADLARQFAVHFTTISAIIHGKHWKHIPWPMNAVQLSMFED